MSEALLNRVIENTFIDGPGNRMAFFLQGCNLRCLYCHNPETQRVCNGCGACVAGCPAGALRLENGRVRYDRRKCVQCDRCLAVCPHFSSPKCELVNDAELSRQIRRNADFIDGVTFSGGECSLQYGFVCDVFRTVKSETALTCFVDTNGYMEPPALEALCAVTDGFMFDLKAFDREKHRKLTGQPNDRVFRNLAFVSEKGLLYEVRTVVAEGFTDNAAEIVRIASYVKQLNDYTMLRLIPFRPYGVKTYMKDFGTMGRDKMESLLEEACNVLGGRATGKGIAD